jgi:hypothetical protein
MTEGEDMPSTKLNVKSEEVHGDVPEEGERVKLIISEAHLTSHTENAVTHERNIERVREIGPVELKLHAMNWALSNSYILERRFEPDAAATPEEYTEAAIKMANQFLDWLTGEDDVDPA